MAAKIKVLVVDDSLSVRSALQRGLSDDPAIAVVGVAADGDEALRLLTSLRPDVITLDVRMPGMDGLEVLRRVMATRPTPVIMVSSLTRRGARTTVEALEQGAVEFVLKPAPGAAALQPLLQELRDKITASAQAHVLPDDGTPARTITARTPAAAGTIVVIASSAGGPQALRRVLPALPEAFATPIIVVQHMPATFTSALAESLDDLSARSVIEARPGIPVEAGQVLIAPGGVHLTISERRAVALGLGQPENGVRPSANVTMASAAAAYGSGAVGVVLTGMGADGTRGAGEIKRAGGWVIAEAESTSVIYGMPRSVVRAGHADEVLPLPEIAEAIVRSCRQTVAA